ncbi:MAG TPA: glutamate formimidoyltransferase [Flavipsychrobacter sp.]|nr:glutamate formimidoyltransferase [Flavipsychrobacter sp.]
MNTTKKILECVPNFSEGRDKNIIESIAESIRSVEGAHLLHVDISPAANRTVMTFAGEPEAVIEAAFQAIKKAGELIDMRNQIGVHPRIGATDVCPLVPLYNMTMDEANDCAMKLGARVGEELNIPVYLYEYSASKDHRRALPDIRKGQYEGFAEKVKLPDWMPDYGNEFNAATGATVIGAREILVAFNIALNTQDVSKAKYIAERIRERGYRENRKRIPGLLSKVRAIGWYMADYNCAQVSLNLLDHRESSPLKVWEGCKALACEVDVAVIGSEVIGLIPERCLLEAGSFVYLEKREENVNDKQLLIHYAIELLGLNKLKGFKEQEKVLEYALAHAGLIG